MARTKPHPDSKLTLRQAYEKHYDRSELSKGTLEAYHYALLSWERLGGNLPLEKIDNASLERFRAASIRRGHSPATTNRIWRALRAMLYRLGPKERGNPFGLGIIDDVPAMKPLKEPRPTPNRLALEDLSKVYIATRHAAFPNVGPPAEWWWQCLMVLGYFLGLRKSDLFALRFDQFDLERGTVDFSAIKTGKADRFPVHPVAIEHVRRIWSPREFVLSNPCRRRGGFYDRFYRIQQLAGVKRFLFHDIRRTAASQVDAVERGLGPVFLQYSRPDVFHRHYANACDELHDAIIAMRLPLAFKHGIAVSERTEKQRRAKAEKWTMAIHSRPYTPAPGEWQFDVGAVWFRGRWHSWHEAAPLRVLRTLATAGRPVGHDDVAAAVYGHAIRPMDPDRESNRVASCVSYVRQKLRVMLYLPDSWDPVVCLRGTPTRWTLLLPPDVEGGTA